MLDDEILVLFDICDNDGARIEIRLPLGQHFGGVPHTDVLELEAFLIIAKEDPKRVLEFAFSDEQPDISAALGRDEIDRAGVSLLQGRPLTKILVCSADAKDTLFSDQAACLVIHYPWHRQH